MDWSKPHGWGLGGTAFSALLRRLERLPASVQAILRLPRKGAVQDRARPQHPHTLSLTSYDTTPGSIAVKDQRSPNFSGGLVRLFADPEKSVPPLPGVPAACGRP